ncbi:MAG TPA: hypothetical protein VK251_09290 [Steroidobacteraceae bacterium]|nr:hypothetical protein [Steroidobacteraceae bacterium]
MRSLPEIRNDLAGRGRATLVRTDRTTDMQGPPQQVARVVLERSMILVEPKFERAAIRLLDDFDIGLGRGCRQRRSFAIEQPARVGEPRAQHGMRGAHRHVRQHLDRLPAGNR